MPIIADTECEVNSFIAMDEWLAAVESDTLEGAAGREDRERQARGASPTAATTAAAAKFGDDLCGPAIVPIYGTPRTVAGDALTTDTNKCRLKPLDRDANYGPFPFTDAQWAQMQAIFPDGVCDFSKPGVDQQGDDPVADLPGREGDGDLRRRAARPGAEEPAFKP